MAMEGEGDLLAVSCLKYSKNRSLKPGSEESGTVEAIIGWSVNFVALPWDPPRKKAEAPAHLW